MCAPVTPSLTDSQFVPYVSVLANGYVERQPVALVAPAQPNISMPLVAFTAAQPVVAISAMCETASADTPGIHSLGAPPTGSTSSTSGTPRRNHSATTSNWSCVIGSSVVTPGRGMPAAITKCACAVIQSVGAAVPWRNTYWNQSSDAAVDQMPA